MKRYVIVTLLSALLVVPTAAAHWSAGGSGAGQAPVETLDGGNRPSATAERSSVTVEWDQTLFRDDVLGRYEGTYQVLRYSEDGGDAVIPTGSCGEPVTGSDASLSCRDDDVPGGAWFYTITPVLGSWTGAESLPSPVVSLSLPDAPILLTLTAGNPAAGQTAGDIDVRWAPVIGASGYNLYRRTSTETYTFTAPLNGATPISDLRYTDSGSGLAAGTSYAYVVRSIVDGVQSASSNELTVTPISRPAAPTSVTATPVASGAITVAWPATAGAVGYNLYRRTSAGSFDYGAPLNGVVPIIGVTFSDTATLDGTGYRYVVRSLILGAGAVLVESASSSESPLATADASPPSGVVLTDPGSPLHGSVGLSASASDANSGVASVALQYTTAGGSTWTTVCADTTAPYSCTLNTTLLTDGLYDLRARATDVAGNAATSATVANRRIDNTGPTVTMNNPGAVIHATVNVSATASDAGSGVASVLIQRAPSGTSTWTDICTMAGAGATCSLVTTALADGNYDLRARATDVAGTTSTSAVVTTRVDNTAPTGTDIQTTSVSGGTPAKPETGDTITYTFSEQVAPTSILAGWSGASTLVTVRIANGNPDIVTIANALNTAELPIGSVTSGKKYVTANRTFTGSTMVQTGDSITVTLGVPSGTTQTATGTTTLQWTTATGITDLAGNTLTTGLVVFETGSPDLDF